MKEITELSAIKYLRATNFDTSKAINLYFANHRLRKELNFLEYNPLAEPLATELFSKKFTVLVSHLLFHICCFRKVSKKLGFLHILTGCNRFFLKKIM